VQDLSFTVYESLENNESKFWARYIKFTEKEVIQILCNCTNSFAKDKLLYVVDDLLGNIVAEIKDGKEL